MILTKKNILSYLIQQRLLHSEETASVQPLEGGGVNSVFLVETPSASFVVKQALENIRVRKEIALPKKRIFSEVAALRLLDGQEGVPKVYHFDPEHFALVMESVPKDFVLLSYEILAGNVKLALAKKLGAFYANLHSRTYKNNFLKEKFSSKESFEILKMGYFHQELLTATKNEKIQANVKAAINHSMNTSLTLIHGDSNLKNILVKGDAAYVIDYELSHYGDPSHDIGNLAAGYILCSLINYPLRKKYFAAIEAFFKAYKETTLLQNLFPEFLRNALQHIAPILHGRIDGRVRSQFISDVTRKVARKLVNQLAQKDELYLQEIFTLIDKEGKSLKNNKPITKEEVKGHILF